MPGFYGAIAQLARAPALQAGGPGFESPTLHQINYETTLGLQRGVVRLEPYDLNGRSFELEKSALKEALEDKFIAAEHVAQQQYQA